MAHQASYRLYRPRRFSEVQGQTRTVDTLREAVRQGRLTHAYLFSGPRGTGKTSVARILAKAVNCENLNDGDPCLACPSCVSIDSGQNLDVIEIDAASNRGIDEIRDIKERITHQTAMSRYKVYIIDEAHMLTPEAFNAFLKTLEEPPSHALFILATTEAHKLPITVLSRCQRYEFKRLTIPVIKERIRYVSEQDGISAEPEALEILADAADGALRDALSLYDQVVAVSGSVTVEGVNRAAGMVGQAGMVRLTEALANGIDALMTVLQDLRQNGVDDRLMLRELARILRDILLYRTAGPDLFPGYRREPLARSSAVFDADIPTAWWIESADQLAQADSRLRGGFPADLAVELALLKVQETLMGRRAGSGGNQGAVKAPSAPPPPAAPEKPSAAVESPQPRVQALDAGGRERAFQDVLEIVKRERPSTFALFEKTTGTVGPDGTLTIYFEFPAHRQLMDQGHHREVVDRAIQAVYGTDARYRFVDGAKPPAADEPPPGTDGAPPSLTRSVKEWFGEDTPLVGFDDQS